MPPATAMKVALIGLCVRSFTSATATGSMRSNASAKRTRVITATNARFTATSAHGTAIASRIFVIGSPDRTTP